MATIKPPFDPRQEKDDANQSNTPNNAASPGTHVTERRRESARERERERGQLRRNHEPAVEPQFEPLATWNEFGSAPEPQERHYALLLTRHERRSPRVSRTG